MSNAIHARPKNRPALMGGLRGRPGWVCVGRRSLGGGLWSDPNQTLTEILASVQPCDRTWCLLDSVEDVLPIVDQSVAHPALEFPQCLGVALDMVKDEKALHSRALDEQVALDPRSYGWRLPARDRHRAADDHPCTDIETAHDGIADWAGRVVEVDIDAPGAGSIKR